MLILLLAGIKVAWLPLMNLAERSQLKLCSFFERAHRDLSSYQRKIHLHHQQHPNQHLRLIEVKRWQLTLMN